VFRTTPTKKAFPPPPSLLVLLLVAFDEISVYPDPLRLVSFSPYRKLLATIFYPYKFYFFSYESEDTSYPLICRNPFPAFEFEPPIAATNPFLGTLRASGISRHPPIFKPFTKKTLSYIVRSSFYSTISRPLPSLSVARFSRFPQAKQSFPQTFRSLPLRSNLLQTFSNAKNTPRVLKTPPPPMSRIADPFACTFFLL